MKLLTSTLTCLWTGICGKVFSGPGDRVRRSGRDKPDRGPVLDTRVLGHQDEPDPTDGQWRHWVDVRAGTAAVRQLLDPGVGLPLRVQPVWTGACLD